MTEERISIERIKQVDAAYPTLNEQALKAWNKLLPVLQQVNPTDWEILLFLLCYGGFMAQFYSSLMPYFKQLERHIQELHYSFPEEIYSGIQPKPTDDSQDAPIFRALAAIRAEQAEHGVSDQATGEAGVQDQGSDGGGREDAGEPV